MTFHVESLSSFLDAPDASFDADFDLDMTLTNDFTMDGVLDGRFEGGGFALSHDGSQLLVGDVEFFNSGELLGEPGVLHLVGLLLVTGGELVDLGHWPVDPRDSIMSILQFQLAVDPTDFASPFGGSGNVELLSEAMPATPEPCTMALLGLGALQLIRRRR